MALAMPILGPCDAVYLPLADVPPANYLECLPDRAYAETPRLKQEL